MGTGYEVDLQYLKDTVTKLQGLVEDMDGAHSTATYDVNLTRNQLGNEHFLEAGSLHKAHDNMQESIRGMIKTLQTMIQEFTDKTNSAHNAYSQHEQAAAGGFGAK
jgi:uncharacterized protein YukE